jgi:hypothetical protein
MGVYEHKVKHKIRSSVTHNCPKLETAQIDSGMDKPGVVWLYDETLPTTKVNNL